MLEPPDTQTRHGQHGRYPQAASVEDFRHNLAAVRARMDAACHRAGRDPAGVRLLPVSKTKPEPSLRLAYAAGCRLLGENKAQEAFGKWEAMQDLADLRWSVIGHLQTEGRALDVFVQVNTSGEASKYGLSPEDVPAFLRALPAFPALRVRGLMTLALFSSDAVRVRQAIFGARSMPDSHYWPDAHSTKELRP